MHKGEHSKAECGQRGISLPASQETVAQHTGRKDEALSPLCSEEQWARPGAQLPAIQAVLWFAVTSPESHNKGSALGSCWVPSPAAVVDRRSRDRAEVFYSIAVTD